MRKIRFRGKKCSDGKWVYGSYVESCDSWAGHKPHKSWIVCRVMSNGGFFNVIGRYAVKDDSVGQFVCSTFVKKDGTVRDIYEGDILRGSQPYEKGSHVGYVKYDEDTQRFKLYTTSNYIEDLVVFSIEEVLGNTFDNPELIN